MHVVSSATHVFIGELPEQSLKANRMVRGPTREEGAWSACGIVGAGA